MTENSFLNNDAADAKAAPAGYVVHGCQPLTGTFTVPGDKSISHRALMLGAIAHGVTRIRGLLEGEDCLNTARALQALGVKIDVQQDGDTRVWHVHGAADTGLMPTNMALDLGNSGTGMRLMAGLLVGQNIPSTLIGDASLMHRPMERIAAPLRQMGANIQTNNDLPPIRIDASSSLKGIDYHAPVASAQIKSAVLLAALGAKGTTSVIEPARSRDHTERMLPAFGCPVAVSENQSGVTGPVQLHAIDVNVPGDISSAAFFIVAASVIPGSDITLTNIGVNPTRCGILNILDKMGARIDRLNSRIVNGEPVCDLRIRSASLGGIDVPPQWVPSAIDEFPIIFIAAALASGTTRVTGAAELKVKESDRLGAMAQGLRQLNAQIRETDDGMEVTGGPLSGGVVNSHGDHRIAMAFAIAGSMTSAPVVVLDVQNVATSFPNFSKLARESGLALREVNAHEAESASQPDIMQPAKAQNGAALGAADDQKPAQKYAPVLTIDGPSGAGKGTISHQIAQRLGWHLLDSGALYRVVGFAAGQRKIALDDAEELANMTANLQIRFIASSDGSERIELDGEDIAHQIRTEHCGNLASKVAAVPQVRQALVAVQHSFRQTPGLVADGRDMGTVIFPDANLKIFLTANAKERAQRRYKQLKGKGIDVSLSALFEDIAERDERDAQREVAPLRPAPDAMIIDTTSMSIDEVVLSVLNLAKKLT